jgi:hypothetical protein
MMKRIVIAAVPTFAGAYVAILGTDQFASTNACVKAQIGNAAAGTNSAKAAAPGVQTSRLDGVVVRVDAATSVQFPLTAAAGQAQ